MRFFISLLLLVQFAVATELRCSDLLEQKTILERLEALVEAHIEIQVGAASPGYHSSYIADELASIFALDSQFVQIFRDIYATKVADLIARSKEQNQKEQAQNRIKEKQLKRIRPILIKELPASKTIVVDQTGDFFALEDLNGVFSLYRQRTGELIRTLDSDAKSVRFNSFANEFAVSSKRASIVQTYDLDSGEKKGSFFHSAIYPPHLLGNGKYWLTQFTKSSPSKTSLIDAVTFDPIWTQDGLMTISHDGQYQLDIVNSSTEYNLYKAGTGKVIKKLPHLEMPQFINEGLQFMGLTTQSNLSLFESATGKLLKTLNLDESIENFFYMKDEKAFVTVHNTGSQTQVLKIWNIESGKLLRQIDLEENALPNQITEVGDLMTVNHYRAEPAGFKLLDLLSGNYVELVKNQSVFANIDVSATSEYVIAAAGEKTYLIKIYGDRR